MIAPVLLSGLALLSTGALAAYVATRREQGEVHRLLLGFCAALVLWSGGALIRHLSTDHTGLVIGLAVLFVGIALAPPLWLTLAARWASGRLLQGRLARLLVYAPSVLFAVAAVTNPWHRTLIRVYSPAALEQGPLHWATPLFWCFIVWAYAVVLTGAGYHLRTARRMVANQHGRRGLVLALASVVPPAASTLYLFRLIPVRFDLTPASLSVSIGLITLAMFRYRLLEGLPLARRDVIEHLRDGVVIAGVEGTVLDLNPAAAAILGAGAQAGRPLHRVLTELADGDDARLVGEALADEQLGAGPWVREVRTPDARVVELSLAWVRGSGGEPAGRFAVLRDRTEERRFERIARQTEKLRTLGTLAGGVAHEVNNPLAFIRSNLSQVQRMGQQVEEARAEGGPDAKLAVALADLREIADETLEGIARIERIVQGMRQLRPAHEEGFEAVDVNEVVRDALRLSNAERASSVTVDLALDEALPPVDGAPDRLVQAVLNLLVNALHALADGGTLRVETGRAGREVEIRVCDDGPGVPAPLQERIFDPFFTTRDPDEGTGLGLPIAFEILRDHEGSLELRSAEGEGACFAARLPARRA